MFAKRLLLLLISCLVFQNLQAQLYTDKNNITVLIEGHKQHYSYTSDNLLVKLDENTNRLECILTVNTLEPNDNLSDPVIPEDVFYARKYPQFRVVMFLPKELVAANNQDFLTRKDLMVKAQLYFQGLTRDVEVPLQFTSERNYISFNTSFTFSLQDMRALMPQMYMNMLTGLIRVSIVNATWVDSRVISPDQR